MSDIKSVPEYGDLALICKPQPSALTRAQYFLVLLPSERATEGLAKSPFLINGGKKRKESEHFGLSSVVC